MLKKLFTLCLLMFPLSAGVLAQEETPPPMPLFAVVDNILLAWEGDPTVGFVTYEACQPGENIVSDIFVSPDGMGIAFETWPPVVQEAVDNSGGAGGGKLPVNIWACRDGNLIQVATIPEDTVILSEDGQDDAVIFSHPAWSPDGSQLAWTEVDYPEYESFRLSIYDFASGETTSTPLQVTPSAGVPGPYDIQWGETGFLVQISTFDEQSGLIRDQLQVFNTDGTPLSDIMLQESEEMFPSRFTWVNLDGVEYVAVQYNNETWVLIDPLTGDTQTFEFPVLVSRLNPEGARVAILPGVTDYDWVLANTEPPLPLLIDASPFASWRVGIAPSGEQVAYAVDAVYVWQEGQVIPIPGSDVILSGDFYFSGLYWGPTTWINGQPVTLPG